jgi:hypothetical protein
MPDRRRRLLGLVLPCLLPWMLDVSLTVSGQPPEYWAGDYSRTTEGGAFYRRMYELHPAAGVGGHLLVFVFVATLLLLLPEWMAVVLALAGAFGSAWGASTWIQLYLVTRAAWGAPAVVNWYQAINALFFATAVVAGVCVWWTVRGSALASVGVPHQPIAGGRWALIAVLFATLEHATCQCSGTGIPQAPK